MAVNQLPLAQVDLRTEAKDLGLGKVRGNKLIKQIIGMQMVTWSRPDIQHSK